MATGKSGFFILSLLFILSLATGCLSTSFGRVTYNGGLLGVQVFNRGEPADAALQVSVFRFQDFRQVEVTRRIVPVRLERGENTRTLELPLEEGTYRLYLYVITGNERGASVIRDITVEAYGAAPRIGPG